MEHLLNFNNVMAILGLFSGVCSFIYAFNRNGAAAGILTVLFGIANFVNAFYVLQHGW